MNGPSSRATCINEALLKFSGHAQGPCFYRQECSEACYKHHGCQFSWMVSTCLQYSPIFFFFWDLGSSVLPKNAPLLDTRISEGLSHIQTHLILNITIACCIIHPAVHLCPPSQWRRGRHGTWPQCISSCVKIATSNPVILMFDSHKWGRWRIASRGGGPIWEHPETPPQEDRGATRGVDPPL